jgi:hypothetical protein
MRRLVCKSKIIERPKASRQNELILISKIVSVLNYAAVKNSPVKVFGDVQLGSSLMSPLSDSVSLSL